MNLNSIRSDFPVLQKYVYLDSACMSLKPRQVIETMDRYYLEYPACGERSSHRLGRMVTEEYESARKKIAKFIGAKDEEIIFTKNATEGLNLVANCLLQKGDRVVTSDKEHNSNFLPWSRFNHIIATTNEGRLDMESLAVLLPGVKVVSMLHTSNIDGMSFPISEISKAAHDNGALMVVDGAQSVPHKEIDVKKLGCDVLAFSGHKMLGPSMGVVYVKKDVAESMSPFMVGGGTVQDVVDGKPTYLGAPQMFEAGLQNYAGAIGLAAAVKYLQDVGLKNIEKHELELNKTVTDELSVLRGVSILGGPPEERGGIVSLSMKIDSREAAIMLDSHNVLVQGGFHCCHNWFNKNKIAGSVRASLYLYNNENDMAALVEAVKKVSRL